MTKSAERMQNRSVTGQWTSKVTERQPFLASKAVIFGVKPDPTYQSPIYRQLGMDLSRLAYNLGGFTVARAHHTKHETSSPHAPSLGRFRTAQRCTTG